MKEYNEKYEKLKVELDRIVEWNIIAGKGVEGLTEEELEVALANQRARTKEECKELASTLIRGESVGKKQYYISMLDDLDDILVTSTYERYMLGKSIEPNQEQTSASLLSMLEVMTIDNAFDFVTMLALQDTPQFNLIGSLACVNDNNFEKFINLDSRFAEDHIKETVKMYEEQGESVRVFRNKGYAIILRNSDDKVMKPAGFIGVNLSPFVFV